MPTLKRLNPSYRKHRASGQAVVTIDGRDHYLGPHGTKASHLEYDRLISLWLANGRRMPTPEADITIMEMLAAWRRHALQHYRKNGRVTGEVCNFDHAIRPLKLLYGAEPVRDFGPLKLQTIQSMLAKGYHDPKRGDVAGLARGVVNGRVARIKRMFRWAVSQEMAPPSLAHALDAVRGLQRGRTDARETAPVMPVDDATVKATLPHLPPVVADMVRLQMLTGCRPHEVCDVRPCDVDRTGDVWQYRPERHKTEHHGRERVIFIGPAGQDVLRPYLLRDAKAYLLYAGRQRDGPARPSCANAARRKCSRHKPTAARNAPKCSRRTTTRKIAMLGPCVVASDLADVKAHKDNPEVPTKERIVPRWRPNQLRHAAATKIRQQFGLEAAQVLLGHSKADVTQIYAERDNCARAASGETNRLGNLGPYTG